MAKREIDLELLCSSARPMDALKELAKATLIGESKERSFVMLRRVVSLAVMVLAVLFLVSCASSSAKKVSINEKDAGSKVELSKGDILKVTLEGNPSTGFSWETENLDEASLKLIYHRSFEPDVPPDEIFEVSVSVK
ncbi:MAG: protease inhibitor I42 family protein [Actinomycetota bacterium]|nr:protease inhibitor I42 family protein [Actinomycetota bacterium]